MSKFTILEQKFFVMHLSRSDITLPEVGLILDAVTSYKFPMRSMNSLPGPTSKENAQQFAH